MTLPFLDAASLSGLLTPAASVAALGAELLDGLDPEKDAPRLFSPLGAGEFLLMPAESSRYAGIKVLTVAPGNPARGEPKIQGSYLLFDARSLAPLAVLDGAELTLIRTSSVTAMAIKNMLAADPRRTAGTASIGRLAVVGTSLQADRHIRAITEICDVAEVVVIGRRDEAAAQLAAKWSCRGRTARAGSHADIPGADVIVCATSSSTPVLDSAAVADGAIVAAIGSHGLHAREIDPALARRADVVVEGRASAMQESGNLIPARSVEEWNELPLTNLAELIAGRFTRRPDAPALYTAVGMSWEDIVVASRAFELASGTLQEHPGAG